MHRRYMWVLNDIMQLGYESQSKACIPTVETQKPGWPHTSLISTVWTLGKKGPTQAQPRPPVYIPWPSPSPLPSFSLPSSSLPPPLILPLFPPPPPCLPPPSPLPPHLFSCILEEKVEVSLDQPKLVVSPNVWLHPLRELVEGVGVAKPENHGGGGKLR